MAKKNNSVTISDLRGVNRVIKKVRERERRINFKKIGEKEEILIIGIGDVSFKSDKKANGSVLLFLKDSLMTKTWSIYWKSKQIEKVYHSLKDAETLNIFRMVDELTFAARQL